MELNFLDIISGKEVQPVQPAQITAEGKLKPSETRARQQSCMVSEIDMDLVKYFLLSSQQIQKQMFKTLE